MTISNNDKINGYRLATLPIYVGVNELLTDETISISPLPVDNSGSILISQKYTFKISILPEESASKQQFRWVVAYGDPYRFSSYFTDESVIAYGETQTFTFTFEDYPRDVFIRADIFDPLVGEEETRVTRILKLKTTTDGESEKNSYIFSFLLISFVVLTIVAVVIFKISKDNKKYYFKANYGN